MIPKEKSVKECRIESKEEIEAYLANLRYALEHGAELTIQMDRQVDKDREIHYTNRYTIASLFPNENPHDALKRELKLLTSEDYIRTVKELSSSGFGTHTAFVMSFHYAMIPFEQEIFPYRKQEEIA